MHKIPSGVRTDSPDFSANRAEMLRLVEQLNERLALARQGGGERSQERHRDQGKLFVRERLRRLLDDDSPFLELSPLAGWDMYENEAPGAGIVTGIGRVGGRRVEKRIPIEPSGRCMNFTYSPMVRSKPDNSGNSSFINLFSFVHK